MKLIFVRHGETNENLNGLIQGRNPGILTEKGIKQAKEAGKEISKKYKIDMIFCSPLQRCVDTMEYILGEYPFEGPIFMSKLLEERDFGEYTGLESDSVNWNEIDKDNKMSQEMGVESLRNLMKRANHFLEDLEMEQQDSTILIVSHNGPIKIMIGKLTGKTFDEVEVLNGSVQVFDYSK